MEIVIDTLWICWNTGQIMQFLKKKWGYLTYVVRDFVHVWFTKGIIQKISYQWKIACIEISVLLYSWLLHKVFLICLDMSNIHVNVKKFELLDFWYFQLSKAVTKTINLLWIFSSTVFCLLLTFVKAIKMQQEYGSPLQATMGMFGIIDGSVSNGFNQLRWLIICRNVVICRLGKHVMVHTSKTRSSTS